MHVCVCVCVCVQIKKYKLTIPSLAAEDKGNYTCIVSNTEGQLEWTFYVDVIGEGARPRS